MTACPRHVEQLSDVTWIRRFFPSEGNQISEGQNKINGNIPSDRPVENPSRAQVFWRIRNVSSLTVEKLYSCVFEVGDYKWQILVFPNGNLSHGLSMYLAVAEPDNLPFGWSKYVHFALSIVNQVDSKFSIRKEMQHLFNAQASDLGHPSFLPFNVLYDQQEGYIMDDSFAVEAHLIVYSVLDLWVYDSKKETGFVGLKNQGATCYMNSLLQTLYYIPYFRKVTLWVHKLSRSKMRCFCRLCGTNQKIYGLLIIVQVVYQMPSNVDDEAPSSAPMALKSIFYKMQYSDNCVSTKALTNAFGWNAHDIFLQHDVQEFNRKLCEMLEIDMKGTNLDGSIKYLFEGHHINYIQCVDVDYKSTREESFYDIQLDVKGCHDVYASFDKFIEVEILDGDNKYHAEQHGLQDAKRGVLFKDFPPVLQLHLKRFEFDFEQEIMIKINDRYEFPLELDLDSGDGKYLSPEADKTVRNLYKLHSVLVHSGRVDSGHYYAFIRPTLSSQWYIFDDERVVEEDIGHITEELYGGGTYATQGSLGLSLGFTEFTQNTNAYMLVYVRDSDINKIICDVSERDITEQMRERLEREKVVMQKEKAQSNFWTIVRVVSDEDLARDIGKNVIFDLVDHNQIQSFCVQKMMPFNSFKGRFAKRIGVPVQFLRFWQWSERPNNTYRPNSPLSPFEEAQSIGGLTRKLSGPEKVELRLFVEVEKGQSIPLPIKAKDDILLFFKLYDPEKEELRYAGRLFVNSFAKPEDILIDLKKMAGFSPDEAIELYEEMQFVPRLVCKHIVKTATFRSSEIKNGDIICFQKSPEGNQANSYPDVPSFLEHRYVIQVLFS